ncbi:MAG: hypothetical protein IJY20_01010, partial [Clostridia bacterium]|nr:hypothetical protein [Clostridia bacterium]
MFISIIQALTSNTAILVYFMVVLVAVAILIISVMLGESKAASTVVVAPAENPAPQAESAEEEETPTERFCMLSEIDRKRNSYGHDTYDKSLTLRLLCEEFRSYA